MSSGRTNVVDGARVLTENGTAVVTKVAHMGVKLLDSFGCVTDVEGPVFDSVRLVDNGSVAALAEPLQPMWDGLDENIRNAALRKLEVVQEILTGIRRWPVLVNRGRRMARGLVCPNRSDASRWPNS